MVWFSKTFQGFDFNPFSSACLGNPLPGTHKEVSRVSDPYSFDTDLDPDPAF
jgi:hypothetical protein